MKKYRQLILDYIKKNPQIKSARRLARLILDNEKIDIRYDWLRKVISELQSELPQLELDEKEVDVEIENDTKWRVGTDSENESRYYWKTKHGNISMTVEFIDQLFFEYSKHGQNLSQTEIINKHNLKVWEWNSIKSQLWLFKNSNIFSPHTVDHTPKKQLESMIEEKMSKLFNNTGLLVEKQYNKIVNKQYKKVINEAETRQLLLQQTIVDLVDRFPIPKQIILPQSFNILHKADHINVTITDLHIGAKVEGLKIARDYDTSIVRGYLKEAAEEINEVGAKHVTLSILGDLIESFTGLNHKNSFKSAEWNMFGNTAIINAVEVLEEFFSQINNLHQILGVGGNHDRSTSDSKEDVTSEIAGVIFYFLKRLYSKHINIEYEYDVLYKEIDGLGYLLTHGHLGLAKNSNQADKLVLKYGNNRIFNLILSGHFHERQTRRDEGMYRWLVCPPIFTGNRYSQDNLWNSTPGMLIISNNGRNLPRIIDTSF